MALRSDERVLGPAGMHPSVPGGARTPPLLLDGGRTPLFGGGGRPLNDGGRIPLLDDGGGRGTRMLGGGNGAVEGLLLICCCCCGCCCFLAMGGAIGFLKIAPTAVLHGILDIIIYYSLFLDLDAHTYIY